MSDEQVGALFGYGEGDQVSRARQERGIVFPKRVDDDGDFVVVVTDKEQPVAAISGATATAFLGAGPVFTGGANYGRGAWSRFIEARTTPGNMVEPKVRFAGPGENHYVLEWDRGANQWWGVWVCPECGRRWAGEEHSERCSRRPLPGDYL